MGQPHKHRDLIRAWADGAEIQGKNFNGNWVDINSTISWNDNFEYRIKPKQKPDDEITRLIKQRDSYRGWADRLANAISEHFEYDIGEHSSANCPWTNAMVCIESPQPIKPEPKTDKNEMLLQLFFQSFALGYRCGRVGDDVRKELDALEYEFRQELKPAEVMQ